MEGLRELKKSTSSGLESANFGLVAEYLKQLGNVYQTWSGG
jgi:hypothetical protein